MSLKTLHKLHYKEHFGLLWDAINPLKSCYSWLLLLSLSKWGMGKKLFEKSPKNSEYTRASSWFFIGLENEGRWPRSSWTHSKEFRNSKMCKKKIPKCNEASNIFLEFT